MKLMQPLFPARAGRIGSPGEFNTDHFWCVIGLGVMVFAGKPVWGFLIMWFMARKMTVEIIRALGWRG